MQDHSLSRIEARTTIGSPAEGQEQGRDDHAAWRSGADLVTCNQRDGSQNRTAKAPRIDHGLRIRLIARRPSCPLADPTYFWPPARHYLGLALGMAYDDWGNRNMSGRNVQHALAFGRIQEALGESDPARA